MGNIMEMKICVKCGKEKRAEEFGRYFDNRDGKYYYKSKCKICLKEYQKQWYEDNKKWCKEYRRDNKERTAEYDRLYYEKHKERYHKYNKWWYENHKDRYCKRYQDNKEYMSEQHRRYKENNKFKINALTAKYRATKKNQIPLDADLEKIAYIYQVCEAMNWISEEKYEVDHIKPISKGGLHHQDNLQILLAVLNYEKNAKWPLTKREKIRYKGLTLEDCRNNWGVIKNVYNNR